ncbi:unnamed protein product [Blepharisma stoltei]|uniref:LNR domain-containing protein n=1 Tax=Blepharisma stoltei TaxID=1481888 RepID=A0AAU9J523_9CILI|nr:unnamed protein product [Blepharisma stoltei]
MANGVCDWACMNFFCQYDGGDCWDSSCSPGCNGGLLVNYQCDPECNTVSCFYDNGDCLCAPGCYPDLLENSKCDSACSAKSCNYDNHSCGDCAINCFNTMINDGVCNVECNNEACGFDGNDCKSCASGCLLSELGRCKPECLVLDCDFDPLCSNMSILRASNYAQIAMLDFNYPVNSPNSCYKNHGCELDYNLFNFVCNSSCNYEDCFYHYFQCYWPLCNDPKCLLCVSVNPKLCIYCNSIQLYGYCVDTCPRYFTLYAYSKLQTLMCVPVADGSTAEVQDESFISADNVAQGDGSIEYPYNSLSYGLSQLAWKYSVVYLMKGTHNLTLVVDDDYLYDATASRPLYRKTNKLIKITVKPLYCSIYNHTGCLDDDEKVTLVVDTNPITLDVLTDVTFENIIFDGSTKFSPYCSDCDYCKKTTESGGEIYDDHGNTLDSNSYVPQSTCDKFQSTNFFIIGSNAILHLNNVEIKNFRQQYNSIITLNGGILNMNSVDFYNIMSKPQSGIILSNSCNSNYCGEIHFKNSSVSSLNNGYEINDDIDLSGFMVLNKINYVEMDNITFENNLVNNIDPEDSTKGMFTLHQILNLTLLNLVLQYNFNYDTFFYINQYQMDMPQIIDSNKKPIYENLINIRFENLLFKNNSSIKILALIAQYNNDLQNILINNCTFLNNFSEDDGIISISYKGNLNKEFISGDSRVITLDSGKKIIVDFPPRNITLKDLDFIKNTFGGSQISLYNLPNLYIMNSNWNENGDNLNEDANTVTINYLKSLSNLYINSTLSYNFPSCSSVIATTNSNNFIFDYNTIYGSYCTSNNAGLVLSSCINETLVQNSVFSENKSSGNSIALEAIMSSALLLKNLTFENNYFYNSVGTSVVKLSSLASISDFKLVNCSFLGGETSIYANSVQNIMLENCTVDSVSNSLYSTLVFLGKEKIKSTISLKNCEIKNNSPKLVHVSISSSETQSTVLVSISGMTVSNNKGGKYIIFIDKSINLDSSSQIIHSTFINNKATSIYARMISGILSINSCIFDSNSASYATILNLDHPAPAETHFSNSKIISNRGDNILYINGNSDVTHLYTSYLYFYNNTYNAIIIAKGNWIDEYSYFYKNSATKGGAVIIKDESIVNLESTAFKENSATSDGGAIYISGSSNITCNNCTIVENTSKIDGGGLAVDQSSIFIFNNSVFSENKCDYRGSAVSILNSDKSYSYLINTEISHNGAGSFASILSDSSLISLQNCSVLNNSGNTNPGIFMIYSACNISDSSFSNHTGTSGSDLSINIDSSLFVYNTYFQNSLATSSAGSISITDSSLICEKCSFKNTMSPVGGTLQCTSGSSCKIINSSILRSYASITGGVIYIFDSTLSIINTKFQNYEGSAIDSSKSLTIEILDSTFQDGVNANGAAINCLDCKNVTIVRSDFKNLTATYGAGIKFGHTTAISSNYVAKIESSIFENCQALYGGAIYSNNINIEINDCKFINNSAIGLNQNNQCNEGEGGALYLTSTVQISAFIGKSIFTDNSACLSGGAIQWYLSQPIISNLSFLDNSALYGDDLASFPLSLKVLSYRRRLDVQVPSAPGQYLSSPLIVGIIDHYGQTVLTESTSTCQLEVTDSSNYSLSGKIKVQASSGIYNFSEIIITGDPGSTVGFSFTSSIVSSSLSDSSLYFKLRECEIGEALATKSCQICAYGTYNLAAGDPCKDCPASAKCYGKNNIFPKQGYWRVNNLTDNFFKCPNSDACLGGIDTNNSIGACKKGYYGNLCQSCENGYSRNGENVCSECPNPTTNSLIMLGMTALALIIVLIMTRSSFKLAYKTKSLTSVYFKIFMNYMQLVVITASFNLNWPQLALELFSIQNSAGSVTDQIFSVDCYLQGQSSKPFFSKLMFMALLPLLLAILTMIFWACFYFCSKNKLYLKNKFIGSLVVQLFLIQPSLVKYNFSNFNCMEIESGSYYLVSDLEIKCWNYEHTLYSLIVALPSILVWCIAVPAVCLWYIHLRRDHLNTIELKLQFGFLYLGFRDENYYWEFSILYRKILIICCSVFLGSASIRIQALTVFFMLIICFFFHRKIHPYRTKQLNALETKSILVSGITIYCGLYYLTDELAYSTSLVLFIIIIAVNFYFLGHWISSMTGIGLWILYSKIRWCRILMGGTRMETLVKNLSSIDLGEKEADLEKNDISRDSQKKEDLVSWRKLKIKEINNTPEMSAARSSAECDINPDNSITFLKEAEDPSFFVLVPHPTVKELEKEMED